MTVAVDKSASLVVAYYCKEITITAILIGIFSQKFPFGGMPPEQCQIAEKRLKDEVKRKC